MIYYEKKMENLPLVDDLECGNLHRTLIIDLTHLNTCQLMISRKRSWVLELRESYQNESYNLLLPYHCTKKSRNNLAYDVSDWIM